MTTSEPRFRPSSDESRRKHYVKRFLQSPITDLLRMCMDLGHVTLWQSDGYATPGHRGLWFATLTLHRNGNGVRHQVRSYANSMPELALASVIAAGMVRLEDEAH